MIIDNPPSSKESRHPSKHSLCSQIIVKILPSTLQKNILKCCPIIHSFKQINHRQSQNSDKKHKKDWSIDLKATLMTQWTALLTLSTACIDQYGRANDKYTNPNISE